jgi:hypothetical protein
VKLCERLREKPKSREKVEELKKGSEKEEKHTFGLLDFRLFSL